MEWMISETLREDLEKAVALLKEIGCSEVYLFGSLSRGQADEHSDLDRDARFGAFLREHDELLRVA